MEKLNYKKTVLPNGLRIITAPMKNTNTITAAVLVKTGARYEKKEENGISHALEHMFFLGTKRRPDSFTINRELDRIGAIHNAYTSRDHTAFHIKADAKYLELSLDILSDMYLNPLFKPDALERERRVVVEEMNMVNDNPMRKIWDRFFELIYPDNSLGWSILGPRESVLALRRKNFVDYVKRFYVIPNTVIVVTGNINESHVIDRIKHYFKNIPKGSPSILTPFSSSQTMPLVSFGEKKIDQTHLMLGMRICGIHDQKRYVFDILSEILGGYMSSRLFLKIREQLGLAYYVHTNTDYFEDTGYFSIAAGLNLQKTELGIRAILRELQKLKTTKIDKKELNDAKSHVEGRMSLRLESSDAIAFDGGISELIEGKISTPEQYLRHIKAVTADDLQRAARSMLHEKNLNLALIGPFKDKSRFAKILKLD